MSRIREVVVYLCIVILFAEMIQTPAFGAQSGSEPEQEIEQEIQQSETDFTEEQEIEEEDVDIDSESDDSPSSGELSDPLEEGTEDNTDAADSVDDSLSEKDNSEQEEHVQEPQSETAEQMEEITEEKPASPRDIDISEEAEEAEETGSIEEIVEPRDLNAAVQNSVIQSGTCGDALVWELSEDGIFTISGSGEMTDYGQAENIPWHSYGYGNQDIKYVVVEEGVTKLCNYCFDNCQQLIDVSLPSSLKSIGECCFNNCSKLTSITLPPGLNDIGREAFEYCGKITSFSIPSGIKTIPQNLFRGCYSATTINIGPQVSSISYTAFYGCSSLTQIKIDSENEYYTDVNGVLFNKDKTTLIKYPAGKTWTSYNVPSGTNIIGTDAFRSSLNLTNLRLADSITTISDDGIYGCKNLKTLYLGKMLRYVGYHALEDCESLTSLEFPARLETLNYCALSYDEALTTITFRGNAPSCKGNTFRDVTATINYPSDRAETFETLKTTTFERAVLDFQEYDAYRTDLSRCTITLSESSYIYDGSYKRPNVIVTYGNTTFTYHDSDFYLSFNNNKNAGNASVLIEGRYELSGSITKYFTISQAAPSLSFASANVSKTTADSAFTNTLTKTTDGTVTFSSGNTSVATVNSTTGQVTIKGAGTATITANAAAGTNYKAGSASYTLTVTGTETGSKTIDDYSYSFANSRSAFGYPSGYKIPLTVYQMLFGSNTKAEMYYKTQSSWGGNCLGFASTSALMNSASSGVTPKAFRSGASGIPDLGVSDKSNALGMNVTTYIELMQISQKTALFSKERNKNRVFSLELSDGKKNLDAFYQTVKEQTASGKAVIIAAAQNGSGHALLAFGLEDTSSTSARVHIYDSNHPLDGDRYMTLTKSSGHWTGWSCDLGGNLGTWSSGSSSSNISFIPCSVAEEIWSTRGNLDENKNVVSFNTGRLEVYNSNDKKIATVEDGELTTSDDEIFLLEDDLQDSPDITFEECEVAPEDGKGGRKAAASGDLQMIALPVGVYTFKNADQNTSDFQIMMVDTNLGAEVITTADEILVSVDDSCSLNAVQVDASETDTYSITLNSTNVDNDIHEVKVTGTGKDGQLMVSQSGDSLNFSNCNIGSLSINGEDQGPYAISASAGTGGKISPSGQTLILKGNSQKYTITPDSGYEVKDVKVDGKSVGAKTSYTFSSISGAHTISAEFQKKSAQKFSDVPSTYAFYKQIEWASDKGIVSGYSDGTFRPQGVCKRKQVVAFLWRLKGSPAPKSTAARFSDVSTKTDFYKAIYWASENNIVLGFSDGTFRPEDTCTRGQVVAFLWRLAGRPAPKGSSSKFSDVTKTNSFYKAILWASENGIVQGYSDGTFRPDNTCTRGQIVAFIYRYANLK